MWTLNGHTLPAGQPFATGDVQYPANVLDLWTVDELAAIGVVWVEPEPVPEPDPVRRTIPKSIVQARVAAVGKMEAVFAALMSQPLQFAQWFAPDWPNVYFDDPGLLAVLAAVGCDPAEIEAITGP